MIVALGSLLSSSQSLDILFVSNTRQSVDSNREFDLKSSKIQNNITSNPTIIDASSSFRSQSVNQTCMFYSTCPDKI